MENKIEEFKDFFDDRPKLNLWDKISLWWKFEARYYHKDLSNGIKNIIYWFPIIWKDRSWDGHYIYAVLKHKLIAQANYIGSNDRHTRAQQDARRMRICVNLIEKIQEEEYAVEYLDYAKDKHWFVPVEGKEGYSEMKSENVWEKYDDYFAKYPLIYKKVMNGEGFIPIEGREQDKHIIAMSIAHFNQDRARKLLFKIISNNIEGWWD